MAATGKTPILLYGSTTSTNVPAAGNLTNSSDGCEIAINVADKNLFFKDSTNAVNTVPIRQSSASSNGWLSSTDWSTFNNKQPAGSYALTTGTLAQFASTTSAQLAGVISDETGSGSLVFGTTPNLNGPVNVLGTNSDYFNAQLVVSDTGNQATGKAMLLGYNTTADKSYIQSVHWGTGYTTLVLNPTAGDVSVGAGNLVIGTSGKGIDFSATAGTGTSELLNDYEEGTWTPTQGAGLTVVGAFSSSGTYTKIGRHVTVIGNISGATSVATSSGDIMVAGLPYAPTTYCEGTAANVDGTAGSILFINGTTSIYSVSAIVATTNIRFAATYFV